MNLICDGAAHCHNCRDPKRGEAIRAYLMLRHAEALLPGGECAYGVPLGVKKGEAKPFARRVVYATPAIDRAREGK